jgi:hypothetical protein
MIGFFPGCPAIRTDNNTGIGHPGAASASFFDCHFFKPKHITIVINNITIVKKFIAKKEN